MNADTCTSDFMQLIEAKNIMMGRQKVSVPVVSPFHPFTGMELRQHWFGKDTRRRCSSGAADHRCMRLVGLSTTISGCSSASLARKGWCTLVKGSMAILHTCFTVHCFLAGRLIVAHFSLVWSISSSSVGSSTLFYWLWVEILSQCLHSWGAEKPWLTF